MEDCVLGTVESRARIWRFHSLKVEERPNFNLCNLERVEHIHRNGVGSLVC